MSSTPTKTENMRRSFESYEMLILNESSPIGGEAALLQVREHVEEVHGGDELDDGVAQELEPLVVADLRLRLVRLPETRHNAEKNQVRLNGQYSDQSSDLSSEISHRRLKKFLAVNEKYFLTLQEENVRTIQQ